MATRVREMVGPAGRACALCGSRKVVLVRSWDQPGLSERVLQRLRVEHDRNERLTDECRDCGARASVRPTPPFGLAPRVTTGGPAPLPR